MKTRFSTHPFRLLSGIALIPLGGLLGMGPNPAAPRLMPAAPIVTRPASDRFLIVAPPEIDPEMVVRARADIDPKMVHPAPPHP